MQKVNIAILASDDGANTENIIQYFENYIDAEIVVTISNKEESEVLKRIRRYRVPRFVTPIYKEIDAILTEKEVHYIIIDNWYEKLPPNFCKKYQNKILNIHPALKYIELTNDTLYQEIKKNDTESGISIYLVNENVVGNVVFHKKFDIYPEDTWEDIKAKTEDLSNRFYPAIVEKFIKGTYEQLYE